MKGKMRLLFTFGLLMFSLLPMFSFASQWEVQINDSRKDLLEDRERSRQNYIEELNKQILRWEMVTKDDGNSVLMEGRAGAEQSFYIVWGDKRQTLFFYGVNQWYYNGFKYGYAFTVNNDSSSETDVNFAVYKLNSNGTIWSKFIGRQNDIHAWNSKTVVKRETDWTTQDFAIIIENDGYFFQKDIVVSGTASAW